MFSKKYDYRQDNPGVQENLERIRQRMVSHIMPAHAKPGLVDSTPEQDTAQRGDLAVIALERQKYDDLDRELELAACACRQIAEQNLMADRRQGAWASFCNAVYRSMKWYTGPADRYWELLTGGLHHVVASLKAHDAVLQLYAGAIHSSQREYLEQKTQLREMQGPKP